MTLRSNYLQENLIAYENIFTRFVDVEYPLPEKICNELKLIQNFMNLSDEEVDAVESYVLKKAGFLSIQTLNSYRDFTKSAEFEGFEFQDITPSMPENTKPQQDPDILLQEDDRTELNLDRDRLAFGDGKIPHPESISKKKIRRKKTSKKDLAVIGLPLLFSIGLIIIAVSPGSLIAQVERRPSQPQIDLEREKDLNPQEIDVETVAKE